MADYWLVGGRIRADLCARIAAVREAARQAELEWYQAYRRTEEHRLRNWLEQEDQRRAAEAERLARERAYNRQHPDRRTRWRQTRRILGQLDYDAAQQARRFEDRW